MRWIRHLCAPSAQRVFTQASLDAISQAIAEGERRHGGQLVLAVEADRVPDGLSMVAILRY